MSDSVSPFSQFSAVGSYSSNTPLPGDENTDVFDSDDGASSPQDLIRLRHLRQPRIGMDDREEMGGFNLAGSLPGGYSDEVSEDSSTDKSAIESDFDFSQFSFAFDSLREVEGGGEFDGSASIDLSFVSSSSRTRVHCVRSEAEFERSLLDSIIGEMFCGASGPLSSYDSLPGPFVNAFSAALFFGLLEFSVNDVLECSSARDFDRKKDHFRISPHCLSDSPNLCCGSCGCAASVDSPLVTLDLCDHSFCRDCALVAVRESVARPADSCGTIPLPSVYCPCCTSSSPSSSSPSLFAGSLMSYSIGDDSTLSDSWFSSFLASLSTSRWCVRCPHCQSYVLSIFDARVVQNPHPEIRSTTCPFCEVSLCASCGESPVHYPQHHCGAYAYWKEESSSRCEAERASVLDSLVSRSVELETEGEGEELTEFFYDCPDCSEESSCGPLVGSFAQCNACAKTSCFRCRFVLDDGDDPFHQHLCDLRRTTSTPTSPPTDSSSLSRRVQQRSDWTGHTADFVHHQLALEREAVALELMKRNPELGDDVLKTIQFLRILRELLQRLCCFERVVMDPKRDLSSDVPEYVQACSRFKRGYHKKKPYGCLRTHLESVVESLSWLVFSSSSTLTSTPSVIHLHLLRHTAYMVARRLHYFIERHFRMSPSSREQCLPVFMAFYESTFKDFEIEQLVPSAAARRRQSRGRGSQSHQSPHRSSRARVRSIRDHFSPLKELCRGSVRRRPCSNAPLFVYTFSMDGSSTSYVCQNTIIEVGNVPITSTDGQTFGRIRANLTWSEFVVENWDAVQKARISFQFERVPDEEEYQRRVIVTFNEDNVTVKSARPKRKRRGKPMVVVPVEGMASHATLAMPFRRRKKDRLTVVFTVVQQESDEFYVEFRDPFSPIVAFAVFLCLVGVDMKHNTL